jgi:hypothetical protein
MVVCESVPTSESGYAIVFEIHLMANTGARGHDAEIPERVLSPAQEDVSLLVAIDLEPGVDEIRGVRAVFVDLHRVVDDEVDWLERIDALSVATELHDCVAHRREVDNGGHSGEILQQDAARAKGDFFLDRALDVPRSECLDVVALHERVVFITQQIFEEDLEAEGQPVGGAAAQLAKSV